MKLNLHNPVSNERFISTLTGHDGNIPGASSGSTDLLPASSSVFNWTATLVKDGGRDSDLTYRFDGRQAAKIPDWVVPQNLTHQFTITTWMKHGPSPGQRAEKETLLCNSDKTGETTELEEGTFIVMPLESIMHKQTFKYYNAFQLWLKLYIKRHNASQHTL